MDFQLFPKFAQSFPQNWCKYIHMSKWTDACALAAPGLIASKRAKISRTFWTTFIISICLSHIMLWCRTRVQYTYDYYIVLSRIHLHYPLYTNSSSARSSNFYGPWIWSYTDLADQDQAPFIQSWPHSANFFFFAFYDITLNHLYWGYGAPVF